MNDPPTGATLTPVFLPQSTDEAATPVVDASLSGLTLDQLETKAATGLSDLAALNSTEITPQTSQITVEPEPPPDTPSPDSSSNTPSAPLPQAHMGGNGSNQHGKLPLVIVGVLSLIIIAVLFIILFMRGTPQNTVKTPTVTTSGKTSTLTLPKDASFTNLKADAATITDNLSVGQQAAVGSLNVNGNATLSGTLTIGTTQICAASGCTPAAGSTNYLQSSGSKQTANFYVQSTSAKTVGGIIEAASKQTADLLELQNSSGSVLAKVDAGGNLTVQSAAVGGSLSVAGNIGVGGGLTVGSNLTVSGHYISGGSAPHASIGAAAGGGTVSVSGNDTFGTVTVTTGASPSSSGMLATVTFANAFGAAPHVVISPADQAAAGAQYYTGTISGSSFQINVAATPGGSTTYTFDYFVGQ